ncbi:ATP-binding cassette domain-containing protein [Gordonia zhaorongruii]|uniref:ATP-binding cassette domain-containing protein n=1 Tax=Gordonia zhaorongruii TaxID=2597659 RepID=UPI001FD601CE|nr:ATP-binding cassette domain-containing protein [Gordonia zhaorongruii]
MPDAAGRPVGESEGPGDKRRGSDPLQDTAPWVPEDDPILRELRAWRKDLSSDPGASSADGTGVRDGYADPAQRAVGSWPHQGTDERVADDADARRTASPTGPDVSQQSFEGPAPIRRFGRRADSESERSGSRTPAAGDDATRSHRLPEGPRFAAHQAPRGPRHAAWDVMAPPSAADAPAADSSGEARELADAERQDADILDTEIPGAVDAPSGSPVTEDERRLSAASTVAFTSITPKDLEPEPGAEPAIVASHLRKQFGDFVAVDDVSFRVPKGTIVALLGPNGAGKTTTVNMLCTLLPPDSGSAVVAGHDVVKSASSVRTSIMLTGQFAALDESLTGRENLILFGRLLGLSKKKASARADELLDEFSLAEAAGKRVGQYSGGMRRRIDIACGLVTSPEVVFLDEPTTGLDPRSRQDVWNLVDRLRDDGVTILLTTQYLEEADVLSDNIVVIDSGRVIAEGTSSELKAATGAAYCEVTPAHPAYLPRLRARLRDLIGDEAADDTSLDVATVSVPAPNGPETLAEVMRRTEAAKIPLADIALRRPSLDEVFLSLTEKPKSDGGLKLSGSAGEEDVTSSGRREAASVPMGDGEQ